MRQIEVVLINFKTNAVPCGLRRCHGGGARSEERIENRVSYEAEGPNQPFRRFQGDTARGVPR